MQNQNDTPKPKRLTDPYHETPDEQKHRFVSRISQTDFDYLRCLNPSTKSGLQQLTINTIFKKLCDHCREQDIETYQDYERFLIELGKLNFKDHVQSTGRDPIVVINGEVTDRDDGGRTTGTNSPMACTDDFNADVKDGVAKRVGHTRRSNLKSGKGKKGKTTSGNK